MVKRKQDTPGSLMTWNHKINPVCLPHDFSLIRDKKISALLTRHFMIAMVSPSSHSPQWYYLWLDSKKVWCDNQFPPLLPLCFYQSVILSGFPYSFFLHFLTLNVLVSPAHKHQPFSSKDNKSHCYFILFPSVDSLIHFYCFTSK